LQHLVGLLERGISPT